MCAKMHVCRVHLRFEKRMSLNQAAVRILALCARTLVAGFASLALLSPQSWAGSGEEQVPVGPRPLALGGAFTALAEGTDALYWNPAGLGRLHVSSIRVTTADQHSLGIQDNTLTLVSPVGNRLGVGIEWFHSSFADETIEDSINRFSLGMGWRLHRRVSAGAAVKYQRYEQAFEAIEQGRGTGWGLDLGIIVQPQRRLWVGASLRDAGGTTLEFDNGATSRPFDGEFTVGAAVQAHRAVLLLADLGRDAHAGAEVRIVDALTLRGGWTKDLEGLDASRWSAGLAFRFNAAAAEYTFQDHPMLEATHGFGLNLDFTLAPQLVEIQDAQLAPLFASFYKSYAVEAPCRIVVSSLHDAPLHAIVRIANDQLLSGATEQAVFLKPGVVQAIDVPLVFGQRILESNETLPETFKLEVSYVSSGRRRTETRDLVTTVYERGTLEWTDGVAKAAAFVTPLDETVDRFTRAIVQSTVSHEARFLNRTISMAIRLFDGLSACGLTYTPDPLNPYAEIQGKSFAIDNIQYPAELLASRSGDCDDSTVLYASMLANVGIRSAFVDVPGHVFLMFDSGIHTRDRDVLGVDPQLFVEREGTLWVPVETTSLGQPFHVAWQRGASLIRQWEETDRYEAVDVQRARQRYEAAVAAAQVSQGVPEVDRAVVLDYVGQDVEELVTVRRQYVEAQYAAIQAGGARERLAIARVYYLNRDYAQAASALEQILAKDRDAAYWNNLGNVQLALGDGRAAADSYTRARALDSADPGIALNRGLVLRLLGNVDESRAELETAVVGAAGVAGALNLLGLKNAGVPVTRAGDELALQQLGLESIEALLREAAVTAGIATAADSTRVAQVGTRANRVDSDAIAESVYWKTPEPTGRPVPPPPPPGLPPDVVSRYPTLECPDRVRADVEFALQVSLTESLLTPQVEVMSGEGPKLQVPVGVLDVVLSAPAFEFRDGVNTAAITVRRQGDSTPAVFHLRALPDEAAQRPIYVTFWHKGGFVGKVMRHVEVLPAVAVAPGTPPETPETGRLTQGRPLRLLTDIEVPDLTLYVTDYQNVAGETQLHLIVASPELATTDGWSVVPDGANQWLRSQFALVASRSTRGIAFSEAEPSSSAQATVDLMRGFGRELYKRYAPKAFKRAFWKLQDLLGDGFETIQVYAKNPNLPWELMLPAREDGSDEQDFLGVRFRIARWHILADDDMGSMEIPPRDLTIRELVVVAPEYARDPLPSQQDELKALEAFAGYRRVPGNYAAVRELFNDLPNGIVHFAGHGEVRRSAEGAFEYSIRLEDGLLDLLAWRGFAHAQEGRHPVFFFNACDVGQASRVANFVDGWAPAVLEAGASAYISGIWPLGDRGASDFAARFYQELDERSRTSAVPLTEVLRDTRKQFYETLDPTYLAYVYYGDANFRVLKATR